MSPVKTKGKTILSKHGLDSGIDLMGVLTG
jgi:hypothetical protein